MSSLTTREEMERSATKRCCSPTSSTKLREVEAKRGRSRRHKVDPLLVLLQRGVLRREEEQLRRRNSEDSDSLDLIGSFGQTSAGETVVEVEWRRHDSLPTPTLAMVETDILGSLDSRSVEVASPIDWLLSPSTSSLWSHTFSDLSQPSCLSQGRSSLEGLASSRRASLPSLSSSYSSWTAPVVGRQVSDSCVPASSILDMAEEEARRSLRRAPRPRDRSADTSKDISEIDDLELDAVEEVGELPLDSEGEEGGWLVLPSRGAHSKELHHGGDPANGPYASFEPRQASMDTCEGAYSREPHHGGYSQEQWHGRNRQEPCHESYSQDSWQEGCHGGYSLEEASSDLPLSATGPGL